MASTQSKSSTKKKTSSSNRGSTSRRNSKNRRSNGPVPDRMARMTGGVVCLMLAFFAAIGYFNAEGWFINIFHNLLCGLTGWGFWIAPPIFALCSYILFFHDDRPVRLRVTCALLLPVILGSFFHLVFSENSFGLFGKGVLSGLWNSGLAMTSGGVISGWLAQMCSAVFSPVGAGVLLVVITILLILGALNQTVQEVVQRSKDALEEYRIRRDEAWEEEQEQEAKQPDRNRRTSPRATAKNVSASRRRPADIPVEDGPLLNQKPPADPLTAHRKQKLFETTPRVPMPGEVLSRVNQEPDPNPYEDPLYEEDFPPVQEDEPWEPEPAPELEPEPEPEPEEEDDWLPEPEVPARPANSEMPGFRIEREPAVTRPAPTPPPSVSRPPEIRPAIRRDLAYQYPPVDLLEENLVGDNSQGRNELSANQVRLDDTLQSFGVEAHIVNVIRGPSVTRYELELERGVKYNKVTNLADDIALSLGASAVRIAQIPDKISTVGIEVPNKQVTPVSIREVIDSEAFLDSPSKVSFAVGKDISGNPVIGNIAKLPHMLIAGTTGSGKSVCTNSLIVSLLYKSSPEEVRLIMVDPKMVELGVYNGIPHLLIPVVTDPKKAAGALQWAVNEMMRRYQLFSEVGTKELASYNNHAKKSDDLETMPQIVVVIDELADLMLVAAKEVEESICRVAQMGRAAGIHLVIATQRPSSDVITGLMKANIPSRIAFAVASSLESRIILDQTGAEKLVGKGDMLYFPLGTGKPQRVQGCFISEEEVSRVVSYIKENGTAQYDEAVLHEVEQNAESKDKSDKNANSSAGAAEDFDEMLPAAIDIVMEVGHASVSMLQRRLKLGYGRAARIVDQMYEKGIVGPYEGSKPRQLLITKDQWQEMQMHQGLAGKTVLPEAGASSEPVPEEFPYENDAIEQSRSQPPF